MSSFRYSSGDRPLDGYTIEHALGRGGFGEVYFAKSDAGREVALKVIQNYEDIELRGVTHCMNLKSSHLVTIFDVKHDSEKRPWVVMEYVAGPCLKELLDEAAGDAPNSKTRGKGIGEDQAMYFMRELIKGMRYLHDSGVVHRDLKPHNIFFEDGTVKIGDYSLSKAISTSLQSGHTTTVGSVHYMAPEIGEGKYGKVVDIYALGVILFEMLTGNPPYVGESLGEVLIKHLTQKPDVDGLDPVFGKVITKAMERKPEDRYQSVDEMLHALCPDDHSSYLPAPASLSMIGDRATNRRAKELEKFKSAKPDMVKAGLAKAGMVKAELVKASAPIVDKISAGIVDTFVNIASLVDTQEDSKSDSQSQPFERPGLSVPDPDSLPDWLPSWLNHLGLWWQRPEIEDSGEITAGESVSLLRRGITAMLISVLFAIFALLGGRINGDGAVLLVFLFPVVGMVACWGLLRTLPRSNSWGWIVGNRLIAAAVFSGVLAFVYLCFASARLDRGFDESIVLVVLLVALLFDWRCFISTTRYPRVGIMKTLAVMLGFFLAMVIMDDGDPGSVLLSLSLIMAATLSIQILAPHGRVRLEESPERVGDEQGIQEHDVNNDAPVSETRLDNESFVLEEEI